MGRTSAQRRPAAVQSAYLVADRKRLRSPFQQKGHTVQTAPGLTGNRIAEQAWVDEHDTLILLCDPVGPRLEKAEPIPAYGAGGMTGTNTKPRLTE